MVNDEGVYSQFERESMIEHLSNVYNISTEEATEIYIHLTKTFKEHLLAVVLSSNKDII